MIFAIYLAFIFYSFMLIHPNLVYFAQLSTKREICDKIRRFD